MKKTIWIIAVLLVAVFTAAQRPLAQSPEPHKTRSKSQKDESIKMIAKPSDSKIIFLDEFDGIDTIPNPEFWELCVYANNAWSQHFKHVEGYENVRIEDGYLKIQATKDDGVYKNGGIRTSIGFPIDTRVEIKARLNKKVRGGFPAIWQMPIGAPDWPRGGEIDIMEWVQGTPNQIYQTIHTYYSNGDYGSDGITNPNPDRNFDVTKFHVYAVDRTEKELIFYVDGEESWRYANMYLEDEEKQLQYPFDKYDFDIILNFSLGGLLNGNNTWPGEIHDDDLPGEMWVDWVKVSKL